MADCRICVQDCSIHEDVWKALKENCRNYKPKPMTNADKLRAMSDEELAEYFTPFYYDGPKFYCPAYADVGDGECAAKSDCRQCWLDWLRQEATDG